jgi:heme/copper-type cytochrome/quinol oxidase subunit 2
MSKTGHLETRKRVLEEKEKKILSKWGGRRQRGLSILFWSLVAGLLAYLIYRVFRSNEKKDNKGANVASAPRQESLWTSILKSFLPVLSDVLKRMLQDRIRR